MCIINLKLTTPVKGMIQSCEEPHKEKLLLAGDGEMDQENS